MKNRIGCTHNHLRATPAMKKWRESVLLRDNRTCQSCGVDGVPMAAHHILEFRFYPEYATDERNGVALCSECHGLLSKPLPHPSEKEVLTDETISRHLPLIRIQVAVNKERRSLRPARPPGSGKVVGICFRPDVRRAMDKYATDNDRSRSWTVNHFVKEYLKEKGVVITDED